VVYRTGWGWRRECKTGCQENNWRAAEKCISCGLNMPFKSSYVGKLFPNSYVNGTWR
jgi:hypothetical protein